MAPSNEAAWNYLSFLLELIIEAKKRVQDFCRKSDEDESVKKFTVSELNGFLATMLTEVSDTVKENKSRVEEGSEGVNENAGDSANRFALSVETELLLHHGDKEGARENYNRLVEVDQIRKNFWSWKRDVLSAEMPQFQ